MSKIRKVKKVAEEEKREKLQRFKMPPQMKPCINSKNKVVDVSSAHNFYKKHLEAVLPCVENEVRRVGPDRYKLKAKLFSDFMECLGNLLENQYLILDKKKVNAGDCAADALRSAISRFGEPQWIHDCAVWPAGRPISEAWKDVGPLRMSIADTVGRYEIVENPGAGQDLRPITPGELNHPRIGMVLNFCQDRKSLPKLTLEIEGAPVCSLVRYTNWSGGPTDPSSLPSEAKKIWNHVLKTLSIWAGLRHARVGKPLAERIQRAAWLRDFKGWSWPRIAGTLCLENHDHTEKCSEKFRKGVEQYWIRVRRQSPATLTPDDLEN